jgi:hypothetical protein
MKSFVTRHFHRLRKTDNHWLRKSIGVLLVIGGLLGFLPVLGFWMLPVGLALLAVDSAIARRLYRQLRLWWGRRFHRPSRARLRRLGKAAPAAAAGRAAGDPGQRGDR